MDNKAIKRRYGPLVKVIKQHLLISAYQISDFNAQPETSNLRSLKFLDKCIQIAYKRKHVSNLLFDCLETFLHFLHLSQFAYLKREPNVLF